MTSYGRALQFGFFLTPDASQVQEVLRLAQRCDSLGLDLIGIQDHPYQQRFLDTWTLLATIAAQTSRVRLFPDVANLPLRPPAMLAKAAATLDLLSEGRFELGIGAGGFWDAIGAMGGPVRTPGDAVAALEEAITVIRLMWSGQRSVRFTGRFYTLNGVRPGPVPAHPIGIWIGAIGPKMLNLTGRLGDGWVPSSPYVPPAKLPEMHQRIDEAAAAAGRDPAAIQRIYNVMGQITDGPSAGFLQGPTDQWVEELTTLAVESGMDSFIFAPTGPPEVQLERFAHVVVPQVKAAVSTHHP